MKKILVVCLGNICRSPTAEAVLRARAKLLDTDVTVDSAGILDYHQGKQPDPRSRAAAEQRGYSFKGIRSRPVCINDFTDFDLILAADKQNLADLTALCPAHFQYKLGLFLSYGQTNVDEIPDPYYGGEVGFEQVLDLIEGAADALLRKI
ncbi:low molecular weight protein-tyrosine-phosphatase [Pseudoalteromonas mariniglutinosa]|uniref:low molecular weight protein-tyrosine-phosphatase n=1 Tax=Pseudoalteromonas mariniglutinosa TaxID=206042 RepID=UPI00384E4510